MMLVAVLAVFMIACSTSPTDKMVKLFNDATEEVKAAKTEDDLKALSEKFEKEFASISEGISDDEMEKIMKDPKVEEASKAYIQAAMEKAMEMVAQQGGVDLNNLGSDSVEAVEETTVATEDSVM